MARRRPRKPYYDYDFADEQIEILNREIVEAFSRLRSVLTLDEINAIGEIGKVYRELAVLIRKVLLLIARYYYTEAWTSERKWVDWPDEDWVDEILSAYDPVSKYVFVNEEDRKRARLVEAVMASEDPAPEVDRAARAIAFQYGIYIIRVADEAAIQSLKDQGTDYVEWVAEIDNRTCNVCYLRDGKIYPIRDLPDKPHINCRCTIRKVNDYAKIEYAPPGDG